MAAQTSNLGVVIVSHNNEADLQRCLDSLVSPGMCKDSQVIVRDCGSTDASVSIAAEHPAVTSVINGANVGFGAACNDAVSRMPQSVEYILFLNPDARLEFDMRDLFDYIEQFKNIGCIGVRQESFTNKLVWSWDQFPTPKLEWLKATDRTIIQRTHGGYQSDRRVDWVMGAFLLIPYQAFRDVSGFDERYFMFCEEVDLCMKMSQIGLSTFFVNEFHYTHDRSDKATVWREVLRLNSRRQYDRKWLTTRDRLACQIAQSYRWLRSLVRPAKPSDRRLALPRLLATWDLLHAATPPAGLISSRGWGQVHLGRRSSR